LVSSAISAIGQIASKFQQSSLDEFLLNWNFWPEADADSVRNFLWRGPFKYQWETSENIWGDDNSSAIAAGQSFVLNFCYVPRTVYRVPMIQWQQCSESGQTVFRRLGMTCALPVLSFFP